MAEVVRYARDDTRRGSPDSVTDAWLLRQFPGRTLEELDGIDWGRYLRATETQARLDAEQLRRKIGKGVKATDIPPEVMTLLREHDALMGDTDG